ncbi:MAG: hypothetical protein JWQ23_1315 [Herminiimonas sp.]|nr:hypothetical protein [Herminiimonas sp.]
MGMEIELKLLIDPTAVESLRKHALLERYAIAPPSAQELVTTYFDTSDFEVRKSDAALRVRRSGTDWIQTLKGGGSVEGGLHQRHEWESTVDGPCPDLAALRDMVEHDTAWGKLLRSKSLEDRILPVFTTKFQRTVWHLQTPEGDDIELALDQGTVEHGETTVPISEIEMELKAGDANHLFDLALELLDQVALRIGNISKAERGYALHSPQGPAIIKASRVELSRRATVEQGLQAILANCMGQIQGNEAGVVHGQDPESVHQMRVGLRRLRSALDMFGDAVTCPAQILEDLDWLAAELGAARDWEVLHDSTLPAIDHAIPRDIESAALRTAVSDTAASKRGQAAGAVNSVRYTRLMLGFQAWAQGARWRDQAAGQAAGMLAKPLARFANNVLTRDQKRLLKRGKRLRSADPMARHRVRIAAKKARYASEFFESLYRAGRMRRYTEHLAALQDELGRFNDAAVADGLLRQLQADHPELAASAGFARGVLAADVTDGDLKLGKPWKRFTRAKLPCRK